MPNNPIRPATTKLLSSLTLVLMHKLAAMKQPTSVTRIIFLLLWLTVLALASSCVNDNIAAAPEQSPSKRSYVDDTLVPPLMKRAAHTADIICLCLVIEKDEGRITQYKLQEVWRWNPSAEPLLNGAVVITEKGPPRPSDTATPEQALLFIHMNWDIGQIGPYEIFSSYHGVFAAHDLPLDEVRKVLRDTQKDDAKSDSK